MMNITIIHVLVSGALLVANSNIIYCQEPTEVDTKPKPSISMDKIEPDAESIEDKGISNEQNLSKSASKNDEHKVNIKKFEQEIKLEKSNFKQSNQNFAFTPLPQTNNNYIRPTKKQRFNRYLNNTFGVGLIGVGIESTIGQFTEEPPEWKKNGEGFARRFGSAFGENTIENSVAYGIEETFKLDAKFYRSKKKDFGSRFKNALISSFTARNTRGKRAFNPSKIAGAYTSNIISTEVWYPKRLIIKMD